MAHWWALRPPAIFDRKFKKPSVRRSYKLCSSKVPEGEVILIRVRSLSDASATVKCARKVGRIFKKNQSAGVVRFQTVSHCQLLSLRSLEQVNVVKFSLVPVFEKKKAFPDLPRYANYEPMDVSNSKSCLI